MPVLNIIPIQSNTSYIWKFDNRLDISNYETIYPYNHNFTIGDVVRLEASQKSFSFDYYEIYSPNTVYESSFWYISYKGFTASFDPNTKIVLNSISDITGSSSSIIAHYR